MDPLRAISATDKRPPHLLESQFQDADVLAATNWLLEVPQMPARLPPDPRKSAADANATKAISSVYSIRSCP